MATEIKVNRQDLIAKLTSLKEDNIGIAGIAINRRKFVEALKLQTQDGSDIITMRYGKVGWIEQYKDTGRYSMEGHWNTETIKDESCIEVSCNHTIMRFLNRPKYKGNIESAKIKHLGFITEPQPESELTGLPIDARKLLEALTFVIPCMASEESRPVLKAILFESDNDTLTLVSADGFRLATVKLPIPTIPKYRYIIDSDNIGKLVAYLKAVKPQGKGKHKIQPIVFMSYTETGITFQSVNGNITLPQMGNEYHYPDYKQLIPKGGTKVEFIVDDLLQAVNAVSVTAKEGSDIIRLVFTKCEQIGKIKVTAIAQEISDSAVEVDAIVESDCKIAVNSAYLKDLLRVVRETKITAKITTPSSPMVFDVNEFKQCVVMPMFVQWNDKPESKPEPVIEDIEQDDTEIDLYDLDGAIDTSNEDLKETDLVTV